MKTLGACLESLLANDDIFLDPENDKKDIENWIKNNYEYSGKLTISDDFVVDCSGGVSIKNENIESLTNGLFRWGKINNSFNCTGCDNLKTLEGAPKKVGWRFYCKFCDNLKSLEGAPEKVGGDFYCNNCENLESLKGAPERVGGGFYCNFCDNLKSLKGAPNEVGGLFSCRNCKKLKITDSDREKYRIKT